jgi:UDP-N-acetylmuramate--alanine ligase
MGGRIHLIGIAGSGMSGLARWYRNLGWTVSGCDLLPGETGRRLAAEGIEVFQGHSPSHVEVADRVVWTAALPADSPELARAYELNIPVLRRSEALAELTAGSRLAAIAGAHGKTTTTAMTGWILQEAGLDPTVFVGGYVSGWNGNFRPGTDLTVVEADEYDRAFLRLEPEVAAVTSFAAEHLECYGSEEALAEAFGFFLERTVPGGCVVIPAGLEQLSRWAARIGREVVTTGPSGSVWCSPAGRENGREVFEIYGVRGSLPVPGVHNLMNASTAMAVCRRFSVTVEQAVEALSTFPGIARRMEKLGVRRGVTVYSDYAHHPDEMNCAIDALRRMTEGRIAVVFQPHLFSRTELLHREMGSALAGCDRSWVLPVYPAREKPLEGVSSTLVAAAAMEAGADCSEILAADVPAVLDRELEGFASVVFMGAGTVDDLAREYAGGGD